MDSPNIQLLNNGEPTHILGGRLDLTMATTPLNQLCSWNIHQELTSDHFAINIKIELQQLQAINTLGFNFINQYMLILPSCVNLLDT